MPFPRLSVEPPVSLLTRVVQSLGTMLEDDAPVDIITFAEDPAYLNRPLYPRQRLILKLYYKIPLTDDELVDFKRLLCCTNKYAKVYFPGLCEHHVLGECNKETCHDPQLYSPADYRILSDDEIRSRLSDHHAHYLEVIAGRRGSKSMLGAIVDSYEIYRLLRRKSPQEYYNLSPSSLIGTVNVAINEEQALILFNEFKGLLEGSPWFGRINKYMMQAKVDFLGRRLFSLSLHSNSAGVRGNTLIAIFVDEICHFNRTTGKSSDKAMMDAISPSILTFGDDARIVLISSPLNMAGEAWELFRMARERRNPFVIAFQLATWEMNPNVPRENPEIQSKYLMDERAAEMEFGGQWGEQSGVYFKPEQIEACIPKSEQNKDLRTANLQGNPSLKYTLHIDLSATRDHSGLAITHYDKLTNKVITDLVEDFDPKDSEWSNGKSEIDHQAVLEYVIRLTTVRKFHFNSITFDQFNSQWLVQSLRRHYGDIEGRWIKEVAITDKSNREMYGNLRSLITQGGIELYRNSELVSQLISLSKTVKPSGAFKIEAPPGLHDDLADALAASAWMCLVLALGIESGIVTSKPKPEERSAPKHLKGCRPGLYCAMGCPIQEGR